MATASGMSLFGLGSAFWGVVIGGLAHVLLSARRSAKARDAEPVERCSSVRS